MTLDEMRDQYEAALAAHVKLPQGAVQFKFCRSDEQHYAKAATNEMRIELEMGWWAWQASRAAVLVDMPKMEYFEVVAEMRQQSLTRAWAKIRNLRDEVGQLRVTAQNALAGQMALISERDLLKDKVEELRKVLTYIRDTSDDWHVCEKAADVLVDAGGDIPDFTPGKGNRARRRAQALGVDYDAAMLKEASPNGVRARRLALEAAGIDWMDQMRKEGR